MKDNLLSLNRVPTLEEMREFFKKNDFSEATYIDIDYDKMDTETVESMAHIKKLMDEHWEPLSRQMGLTSASAYYDKDNPLIAMRDNMENLVAGGVMKLVTEHPGKTIKILAEFIDDNGEFNVDADSFLDNAVETLMKVANYEEVAELVKENPTHEDFNHRNRNNFRAKDFDRKWNHTRSDIKTIPLERKDNDGDYVTIDLPDIIADAEDEAIENIMLRDFWCAISDDDKKLLQMKMSGMKQAEIAEKLGYKTHSTVSKRLKNLKNKFEQLTNEESP